MHTKIDIKQRRPSGALSLTVPPIDAWTWKTKRIMNNFYQIFSIQMFLFVFFAVDKKQNQSGHKIHRLLSSIVLVMAIEITITMTPGNIQGKRDRVRHREK